MSAGRRTARHGHGLSKQDRGAIKAFAAQAKEYLPGAPVELPIACPCSYLPYPHLLSGAEKDRHDGTAWTVPPATANRRL